MAVNVFAFYYNQSGVNFKENTLMIGASILKCLLFYAGKQMENHKSL